MPRVVVLDNLSSDGLQLLESNEQIDFDVRTGLAGDELRAALLDWLAEDR